MKRCVFALGETLLDIIFENGQPVKAVPGGSMVNAAISLGRTGIPVHLISEFGNDPVGNVIGSFLERNNVQHFWCYRYSSNKTSVAMAFLDERKNASYTFYHDIPESIPDLPLPKLTYEDIVLFGSFYSVKQQRHALVKKLLQATNRTGALSIYDPNIRSSHHGHKDEYLASILENFQLATIVKGSDEDFFHILGTRVPEEIYSKTSYLCPFLYISQGSKDLVLMTPDFTANYQVPPIVPVSTIGAGDSFNAGLIYGLIAEGVSKTNISILTRSSWDIISAYGLEFAKAVCLSFENYVPSGLDPVRNTKLDSNA